jgi:hypothetical protein
MHCCLRFLLWIIAIALLSTTTAWTDQEKPPYPHVTASSDGRFYFKMIPTGDWPDTDSGEGICYAV